MYVVHSDDEREVQPVVEERRSGWTDPRVVIAAAGVFVSACSLVIAIIGLFVLIGGGLVGIYVVSQTKTATSEVSNQTIVAEIQKMNSTLTSVSSDVKELTNAKSEQAALIAAQDKINTKQDQDIGVIMLQIDGLEKTLARFEGRLSK